MEIVLRQSSNNKIEIIELAGGLNGSGAIELRDWLFDHLDNNRCKGDAIINLKRVSRIDGLGMVVLEHFMNRGIDIRLLNVGPEIRLMLKMAGKNGLINKIYSETDYDRSVSIFEKEIAEGIETIETGIRKRHSIRANTSFIVEFKYLPGRNEEVLCNASVVNLSETGLFVNDIRAFDLKNRRLVDNLDIVGQSFYGIKFELNGGSQRVETEGEYVRKNETNGSLGVGMRFKDMKQYYREIISDYIFVINIKKGGEANVKCD